MGDNALNTITQGTTGSVEQINQYKEAMSLDLAPRNAQGTVEDLAGNSGTASHRFKQSHSKEIYATHIYENQNMSRIVTEYLAAGGSQTLVVPVGVSQVTVEAWGFAGSGAYNYYRLYASGGGAGRFISSLKVSPLDTLDISFTSSVTTIAGSLGTVCSIARATNGTYATVGGANTITAGAGGIVTADLLQETVFLCVENGGYGAYANEGSSTTDTSRFLAVPKGTRGGVNGGSGSSYTGASGAVIITYWQEV